jgi:UTP-glucose-1-phosphate uridylyltransferase
MNLTLVVLAAGMGSRYGGMKQLDRLGPSGETIMEYSVYDALQAGFNKVVFVIRRSFENEFREAILNRIQHKIQVELAFQELDDLPAGFTCPADRKKPWGTAHALWVCKDVVNEPFAVINADDFYGREAYEAMARYLGSLADNSAGHYAMCGYRLRNTLSEHGEVSRGICQVNEQGLLENVAEHTAIARNTDGQITSKGQLAGLQADDIVSMNFWGFTPDIFEKLNSKLVTFLTKSIHEAKSEFYIPIVVDELIREKQAQVFVLSSQASWFGVTYKEDKQDAINQLQHQVSKGIYPNKLW